MVEPVGITAGISALLKTLTTTGIYLQGVGSASREAQDLAKQVHATEAILTSLQASIKAVHRSNEFYEAWGETTELVMSNSKTTTEQLNGKLGSRGGKSRLSFWSKIKWPLQREDGLQMQQHMQAYMQMLSLVQNALFQGNIRTVQESAQGIEDIFTEVALLPPSKVSHHTAPSGTWSDVTVMPSDSVSQIGSEMPSKTPLKYFRWSSRSKIPVNDLAQANTTTQASTLPARESEITFQAWSVDPARLCDTQITLINSFNSLLVMKPNPPVEEHGHGDVVLALANDRTCIWILFRFGTSALEELRWCSSAGTGLTITLDDKYVEIQRVLSGQQIVAGLRGGHGHGDLAVELCAELEANEFISQSDKHISSHGKNARGMMSSWTRIRSIRT